MNFSDIKKLNKVDTYLALKAAKEKKSQCSEKIYKSLSQRDLLRSFSIGTGVVAVVSAIIVLICTILVSPSAAILFSIPALSAITSLVLNLEHKNTKTKIANLRRYRNGLDDEIVALTEHYNKSTFAEFDDKLSVFNNKKHSLTDPIKTKQVEEKFDDKLSQLEENQDLEMGAQD